LAKPLHESSALCQHTKQQLNINSNNKNNCVYYALVKFKNSKMRRFMHDCSCLFFCTKAKRFDIFFAKNMVLEHVFCQLGIYLLPLWQKMSESKTFFFASLQKK